LVINGPEQSLLKISKTYYMKKNPLFPAIIIIFSLFSCVKNPLNDQEFSHLNIDDCLSPTSLNTFDILSWNIKTFPLEGNITINLISEIIKKEDADLIALQELSGKADFDLLVQKLPDWSGEIAEFSDLNLAFLFKTSEVNLIGDPVTLFENNDDAFPRSPLQITAEHHLGLRIFLINVHLKCCPGPENEKRRRKASIELKTYIDERLPNEKVIILGDFNDEIYALDSSENVFYNFIIDSLNYRFTDLSIARGDSKLWSYPSWPGHIDHILITNELFEYEITTQTLAYDICDSSYFSYISDHRPIMIKIK